MDTRTDEDRRHNFIRYLYHLHDALASPNRQKSAEARRALARLRRVFNGGRHEAEAYDVVFPYDPPYREQEQWLLVAALFALHPRGNNASGKPFGRAMGLLAESRSSARRRFTQILSVEGEAFDHYVRQAVRLLCAGDVPLDYGRLLIDLVQMGESVEATRKVRLRWAREFHRPEPAVRSHETDTLFKPAQENL